MKRSPIKRPTYAPTRQSADALVRDQPIEVTTTRAPGEAQVKDGSLLSAVYLAFVRRLGCYFCEGPDFQQTPTEAHHFPGKGRSGITRDDKTIPVCRAHHRACHGLKTLLRFDGVGAEMVEPLGDYAQRWAADATFRLFADTASPAEWAQFNRERERWAETRSVVVPT